MKGNWLLSTIFEVVFAVLNNIQVFIKTNYFKPIVRDLSLSIKETMLIDLYSGKKLGYDFISNSGSTENIERKDFTSKISRRYYG